MIRSYDDWKCTPPWDEFPLSSEEIEEYLDPRDVAEADAAELAGVEAEEKALAGNGAGYSTNVVDVPSLLDDIEF